MTPANNPQDSSPAAAAPKDAASIAAGAAAPKVAFSVAVVGGSGYTGALLAELLLRHPSVELMAISSESLAGQSVHCHLPRLRTELSFCCLADLPAVEVAFLCTPHGETAPIAKELLDAGVKVIDLSADFRLHAATYRAWYGEHPHPELLPGVYGLTELHREEIAGAQLVANPGCYPTAAQLALEPLKPLRPSDVIVDAKSGVSGAGKTPKATSHYCAVDEDLVAYGVGTHRHYPEVAMGVPEGTSLTFVPHLVPLQRGISETIYVRVPQLPSEDELVALYAEFYAGERFVEITAVPPQLKDVRGTNCCRIFPYVDERAGRIVLISVIDNLMKGASGQALQNMNVMLGLDEWEGLI